MPVAGEPRAAPSALGVQLFGSLTISAGGRRLGPRDLGGLKPKQLLVALLLARGRCIPKARLAELLWGDARPRDPSATLENYVSVLRRRLAPVAAVAR